MYSTSPPLTSFTVSAGAAARHSSTTFLLPRTTTTPGATAAGRQKLLTLYRSILPGNCLNQETGGLRKTRVESLVRLELLPPQPPPTFNPYVERYKSTATSACSVDPWYCTWDATLDTSPAPYQQHLTYFVERQEMR